MADKKNLPNPFPGLRPFQSDEEHLFFGRESQTLELLQLLRDNRFVGVIGSSGSGKSSLVRCGLLSELYGGSFLEAGTDWEVAVMNPGGGPFNQLSKSLVDADIYDSEEADIHLKLNATLRRSRLGLVEAIRQAKLPEGTNFLLVVDQFEEIFRYSETGEEEGEAADDFISMILEAAKQSTVPVYVIITMRSDYIGDCSKFEGLPEEINEGEYLIPRLSREEYKSVIEGPVRVGGAKLAPRLLQRLLNDIGTESDQLPCLQHALMRTWDAWTDRDGAEELDLEDYRAIGGMGKALSIHADEIFDTFDKKDTRETATRMFRAITEKGDDNRGIRRPLRLQQLADITNHSIEEVKAVVDPYRQQGVTFLMPPSDRELEADTVIDISHESLMRVWQRLRNWVEEEAQSARIYRRLVDTSSLWKKKEAGLYHDPDLQIAQSWRDKYQPNEDWANLYGGGFEVATEFLEASEEEGRKVEREKELARQKELEQAQELAEARERSARNMKRFAAVVGFVAIIALGAMVFAVKQQKEATKAQNVAEVAKETLRQEFIRSDINLGLSFSEQGQSGRGLAHFARVLEREPNSPAIIDRSFNILAYNIPPGYRSPDLDFGATKIETSKGSPDGSTILTAIYTDNERNNQTSNLMVWKPGQNNPQHSIYVGPGRFEWGNDIAISPDGKTAALALDGLFLLNIEEGTINRSSETNTLRGVRFSTDGKRLLTGTGQQKGNAAQIWNSETGEIIKTYESKAYLPIWSPDETKILYPRHRQGQSAVVDITNDSIKVFKHDGIPEMKEYGAFDRTGDRFLSITGDQKFNVWDIKSGELQFSVQHPILNGGFTGAVGIFTPDNQKLLTVGYDLSIRLWSADDGKIIDSVNIAKPHAFNQEPLFSNDGKRVLIPLRNGQAYAGKFDAKYSKLPTFNKPSPLTEAHAFLANDGTIPPLLIPSSNTLSGIILPNEPSILVGSSDGKASIYSLSTGEQISQELVHSGEIRAVTTSYDGSKIATSSNLGTVFIWNRKDLSSPITKIGVNKKNNSSTYQKLHFTPDGNALWINTPLSASKWDSETGKLIANTGIQPTKSTSVSSADGTFTAITRLGSVKVFNNEESSANAPITVKCENTVDTVCFSHNNKYLITGSNNGQIRIWSTADGSKQKIAINVELAGSPENIDSIAVNRNFELLAVGCKSGNIYLFNLDQNGNAIATIKGDNPCSNIIFSKSGRLLAATFTDGESSYTQVWEANNAFPVTDKLQNGTGVSRIAFHQNETQIVAWPDWRTGGSQGIASVWDISISTGMETTKNYGDIIKAFGKLELNADSKPVDTINISNKLDQIKNLKPETNLAKFFNWLQLFPSHRSDSPFRPKTTTKYTEHLLSQNDINLLNEAVRIAPMNASAIAKRGAYRLSATGTLDNAVKALAQSDVTRGRLLEPNNAEALWYAAIVQEYLGNNEKSEELYAKAKRLEGLSLNQLTGLINLQDILDTNEPNRRHLLNIAVTESTNIELSKKFIIKRFTLSSESGNYNDSMQDWKIIKDWETLPVDLDIYSLGEIYLDAIEKHADHLAKNGKYIEAIELVKPPAIASLTILGETLSPLVSKLIEWENREAPPSIIIPANSSWDYFDKGTDPGAEWFQPWFIPNGWSKGIAKLGYGDDGEVTKLSYGGDPSNVFPAYYFRHVFEVTENNKKPFLYANVIRDDAVIVYLNGKEVIRDNMSLSTEATYQTYSSGGVAPRNGELDINRFAIDGSLLELGSNVIAAEIHQSNKTSSDIGFQLELLGSNQDSANYLNKILNEDTGKELVKSSISLIPKPVRTQAERALLLNTGEITEDIITNSKIDTISTAIHIAQKLKNSKTLNKLIDQKVLLLEKSLTAENLTERVIVLNYIRNNLIQSGASNEEIYSLEQIIASPPRKATLPRSQIDLSKYYNASMFHYSNWWGSHEGDDLRTLPEQYNQEATVPFDLRGIIQVNSAENDQGKTVNEFGWVSRTNKTYPDSVRGIKVEMKANKIHFLTGLLFGNNVEKGKTAANIIIHYDDDSKEKFPIIAKVDVFDYWIHETAKREAIESLDADKIGWIGESARGHKRALTKCSWENPHPDKKISHIDFEGALSDTAPFIVAITAE
ncbi:MAG: hypothetical protein VYB73_03270 [Verrucomicrobiota bacterium]|nr:hypothetical protein [Verrucomicrobiota bacterium]